MAAAAALVGSSPGGSRAIPITTLSFLGCARLGCGVIAEATTEAAVATRMDSFLNIRLLPAPILFTNGQAGKVSPSPAPATAAPSPPRHSGTRQDAPAPPCVAQAWSLDNAGLPEGSARRKDTPRCRPTVR